MKKIILQISAISFIILILYGCKPRDEQRTERSENSAIPGLVKKGNVTQLIVDGKPFIILGGELGNSTFTSMESMEPVWPKLKALNLNTLLAPVYWELMEPEEGIFDFALYDQLFNEAEKNGLKVVVLWFGAWKNSMSSHAPSWVKKDQVRFPRIRDNKGKSHEILSPFSENTLTADRKAFETLMDHIRKKDKNHNIIMIQVENEIGMLPVARDYSDAANEKFEEAVPAEFVNYLKKNKDILVPEFQQKWAANGFRDTGTWENIFGKSVYTDEIFMAWHYAQFVNSLVEYGKKKLPLPMFVNAALNRPEREPGTGYPSAGPLPHIMDVWKAGAPLIDFLSPDFYFPNIEYWCDLYTRQENTLFIPEHVFDNTAPAKAAFTIGHYESLGFSPFSIESIQDTANHPLGRMYHILQQMVPMIADHHGQDKIEGVLFDKEKPERILQMGNYELTARHSYTLGYEGGSRSEVWDPSGAVIIQTGENEFYLAGTGIVITFKNILNPEMNVGLLKVDEGKFDKGEWKVIRHLNGDQTHQGRHVRIFNNDFVILRFELYDYN